MSTETLEKNKTYSPQHTFRAGLERHVWPASNGHGTVTKTSSDDLFGPNGLGLSSSLWMRILSFLARTGIQEQTNSQPGETDIAACVEGWGQGACSSRVLNVNLGVDEVQLERFITHLQTIATEFGIPNRRITARVLATFIATQDPEPYSTWQGLQTVKTARDKFTARFRGHVQWQGFDTLCGQVDNDGVKHVSPELIREFFNSEVPFFERLINRRQSLKDGNLKPGEPSGVLANCSEQIDLVATDKEYQRNKSGLWIMLKITGYMLFPRRSKLGPLVTPKQ